MHPMQYHEYTIDIGHKQVVIAVTKLFQRRLKHHVGEHSVH